MAINTIDEADRKSRTLIERENRILEAERGLRRLESEANEQLTDALEMKSNLIQASISLRREQERLNTLKNSLNSERFRLHTAAMEMSRQMDVIRRSLSHVMRQQRLLTLSDSSKSSVPSRWRDYSDEPPVDSFVDPIFSNIMYSINAAAVSLETVARNLIDPQVIPLSLQSEGSINHRGAQTDESDSLVNVAKYGHRLTSEESGDNFQYLTIKDVASRIESISTEKQAKNESLDTTAYDADGIENVILDVSQSAMAVKSFAMKYGVFI